MTQFTHTDLTLTVLAGQSHGLIRAEVQAMEQRAALYQGVRDAVLKLGLSVDEVSAATGLTPTEIRQALSEVPALDELAVLSGVS
jgi:hypothetical protein